MSYLKITIGGKERGLKVNRGAVDVYFDKINYTEVGASAVYAAVYAALVGNCIVKNEDQDFDFEQACEWVDELYNNGGEADIKMVVDLMLDAESYKVKLADIIKKIEALAEENEPEKKVIKKKVK